MTASRWSLVCRTPSRGEVAHRLAASFGGGFGPSVQAYDPEEASSYPLGSAERQERVRWLWACQDCRYSEAGHPTRSAARHGLRAHRARCSGVEPPWLVEQRLAYQRSVDAVRRSAPRSLFAPVHRSVDRILMDAGDGAARARREVTDDV